MVSKTCTIILKSGARKDEPCGAPGYAYNVFKKQVCCRRHNTMNEEQVRRSRSNVLCNYTPGLCLGFSNEEIDIAVRERLDPDPIGDLNIHTLKGYINMRLIPPVMLEEMPIVGMADRSGYGEHFDRASLAKIIKETCEYIYSRPDCYTWDPDVSIDKLVLKKIWYNYHIGQYIIDIHIQSS